MDRPDCCSREKAIVGVAAVPGIPLSISWCKECLAEGSYGPYDIHWSNLATLTTAFEDGLNYDKPLERDKIHAQILRQAETGQIADWALEMIVWRDGYKLMYEALKEGPPKDE